MVEASVDKPGAEGRQGRIGRGVCSSFYGLKGGNKNILCYHKHIKNHGKHVGWPD